ncbi:hypothetical protein [Bacillus solimangrovi]|uniref:Uncharacterized protein n=1 Tax=Bacillus solimangrovi TaxID=1305675 RepID=A0A1E5LEK9_9BACI|nr:hypothetical protein [Bacillus solimangrovi]OEH92510.1 hypothetical protein BFG57_15340 [Bacillus solimangrovi]
MDKYEHHDRKEEGKYHYVEEVKERLKNIFNLSKRHKAQSEKNMLNKEIRSIIDIVEDHNKALLESEENFINITTTYKQINNEEEQLQIEHEEIQTKEDNKEQFQQQYNNLVSQLNISIKDLTTQINDNMITSENASDQSRILSKLNRLSALEEIINEILITQNEMQSSLNTLEYAVTSNLSDELSTHFQQLESKLSKPLSEDNTPQTTDSINEEELKNNNVNTTNNKKAMISNDNWFYHTISNQPNLSKLPKPLDKKINKELTPPKKPKATNHSEQTASQQVQQQPIEHDKPNGLLSQLKNWMDNI